MWIEVEEAFQGGSKGARRKSVINTATKQWALQQDQTNFRSALRTSLSRTHTELSCIIRRTFDFVVLNCQWTREKSDRTATDFKLVSTISSNNFTRGRSTLGIRCFFLSMFPRTKIIQEKATTDCSLIFVSKYLRIKTATRPPSCALSMNLPLSVNCLNKWPKQLVSHKRNLENDTVCLSRYRSKVKYYSVRMTRLFYGTTRCLEAVY